MNDYELDKIAKSYAKDIADEIKEHGGDAYDLAHETVDSCKHVIYYARPRYLSELRHVKR